MLIEKVMSLLKSGQDLLETSNLPGKKKRKTILSYLKLILTIASFGTALYSAVEMVMPSQDAADRGVAAMIQAARDTAKKDTFAEWLLNEQLYELRHALDGKGRTFRVSAGDLDEAALQMMNHVGSEMIATSSAKDWWKRKSGSDYQSVNTSLGSVKKITRIFLYETDDELRDLAPVLREQKNAHITVLTAPINDLFKPAADYVLIDNGRIAGKLILSRKREPIEAEFYFDKQDIEHVRTEISLIMARAEAFD